MKNFVFLAMGLFIWACSPKIKIDPLAEKAALMTTAKAYQDACTIMNVEKIVAFYTSDAKVIPPGGAVSTGTNEIRKFMQEIIKLKNFQAKFETPEVEISSGGDVGYSLSSVVLSYDNTEGKTIRENDRDFHVWKKVGSEWKLAIDIWNSAPAQAK